MSVRPDIPALFVLTAGSAVTTVALGGTAPRTVMYLGVALLERATGLCPRSPGHGSRGFDRLRLTSNGSRAR
ncbi:hypothetical protein [Streptomyces silvisoli]|uniref:Uncharacterized protein n=1 Tax=Streptomyces silvisoli TaxID=3034235 RepID=A0ABT5ZWF3_9ACTN|nr:hypothetical protein [Streptomyces silvisoli]MDF3294147.1 hypothetical protein [Streptomyces silvisoli]